MATTAGQVFRDLEQGKHKPLYLLVGEEEFQINEILEKFRAVFLKDENSRQFSFESWEGEALNASSLIASLETLPGLFDSSETTRLVFCQRFEKASPTALELLDKYFASPNPSTCFVMVASKIDKRKAWVKTVVKNGDSVEVAEPYDRDWPKWHSYFEKKAAKKIETAAWDRLVESGQRTLSLVWGEVDKAAVFIGEKPTISEEDVKALTSGIGVGDVFQFAEDVVMGNKFKAMKQFENLLQSGENEIKILSILVRQYRLVEQTLFLTQNGVTDSKTIAGKIGVHPFFVGKILTQSKKHTLTSVGSALTKLSDIDYRLKTGQLTKGTHFLFVCD